MFFVQMFLEQMYSNKCFRTNHLDPFRTANFTAGLVYTPLDVNTLACRTCPLRFIMTSVILPFSHSLRFICSSMTSTMSPISIAFVGSNHFVLLTNVGRYSLIHLFQKISSCFGVSENYYHKMRLAFSQLRSLIRSGLELMLLRFHRLAYKSTASS